MKDLPPLVAAIPKLRHALYADDLTLWVPTGCTGAQQDAIQEAIQVTRTGVARNNPFSFVPVPLEPNPETPFPFGPSRLRRFPKRLSR